jgi:large subunit ribosomal protein L24e
MVKCSVCSKEIGKGTGMMYVHRTGHISYFCSNRCYRSAIVVKRKLNKKEIAQIAKAGK